MRAWLLLFLTAALGVCSIDINTEAIVKAINDGRGEVPVVSKIIKIVEPFSAKVLGSDYSDNAILQKHFDEIYGSIKRFEVPNGPILENLRNIDINSFVLMEYLELVFSKGNSTAEYSIQRFLEKCKKYDPFDEIMGLRVWIEHNLGMQLKRDPSKSKLMVEGVYNILNELTIVYLFQHYLNGNEGKEDRDYYIEELERELEAVRNTVKRVLEHAI